MDSFSSIRKEPTSTNGHLDIINGSKIYKNYILNKKNTIPFPIAFLPNFPCMQTKLGFSCPSKGSNDKL